ncbi:MAG: hypothetical protein BGO01_14275 [Armatimonadetes bacterium 55-13]|nr:hypothetical protein [Armatimonadota bacterium]OJU64886.1 MAG: hypothetical protein BGO01_14275 [Armatimonadetes bacterium 55-13]
MFRSQKPLILIAIAAFAVVASAADKVSVAELAKSTKKYDGKVLTLVGKVDKFVQRTSKAGNPYFLFKLIDKVDKNKVVNVYGQGKLEKEPKKDDLVEVTGKYFIETKSGDKTYKNELQTKAEQVKPAKK